MFTKVVILVIATMLTIHMQFLFSGKMIPLLDTAVSILIVVRPASYWINFP